MKCSLFFLFLYTAFSFAQGTASTPQTAKKTTITFYATDSVPVTADTYFLANKSPMILLCHQAGYSRGEYLETARKLNALGFSCMAIDQRSGKEVNGVKNETAAYAVKHGYNVGYAGAKRDIDAAIDYLYTREQAPIILVGSSYSASLSLWIAAVNNKVKAVAAFSPGEYLSKIDVSLTIQPIAIPAFVTSSKRESGPVTKLLRHTNPDYVQQYIPSKKGIHGSRALWETTEGVEGYWKAFTAFLEAVK